MAKKINVNEFFSVEVPDPSEAPWERRTRLARERQQKRRAKLRAAGLTARGTLPSPDRRLPLSAVFEEAGRDALVGFICRRLRPLFPAAEVEPFTIELLSLPEALAAWRARRDKAIQANNRLGELVREGLDHAVARGLLIPQPPGRR